MLLSDIKDLSLEELIALREELDERIKARQLLEQPFGSTLRNRGGVWSMKVESDGNGGIVTTGTLVGARPGFRALLMQAIRKTGADGISISDIVQELTRAGYPYPDDKGKVPVRTRVTNELWRARQKGEVERHPHNRGRFRLKEFGGAA